MSERIFLRACGIRTPGGDIHAGVVLPDGRILASMDGALQAFSSERALHRELPGSTITYLPDADEAMNYVSPEDT